MDIHQKKVIYYYLIDETAWRNPDAGSGTTGSTACRKRLPTDGAMDGFFRRHLQAAGIETLAITAPDTQDRRRREKDGDLHAQNAAHATWAGNRTVTPKPVTQ